MLGEQPLLPWESCTLGSVNLALFIKEEKLDEEALKEVIRNAVRFLDDVVEVNAYPLMEVAQMSKNSRKIGLGVMGFADYLNILGIPYDSQEGRDEGKKLMRLISETAWDESAKLASEKGPFPLYEKSELPSPVRNATVTTLAPTGTISIIAGCSSGIEPVFAYAYERNVMDSHFIEVNAVLKEVLRKRGFSEEIFDKILKKGSVREVAEIPEDIKRTFVSASEVSPEAHVLMQAAFQEYTDNAVSKTVNLPAEATRKDVQDVYLLAYETGCKGVTVYRDGSRETQVLTTGKTKGDDERKPPVVPRKRKKITQGFTEKMRIGCGSLFVTVNYDEQGICEIFTSTGKAGGCPSQSEAAARLASVALRSGIDVNEVCDQLKGIRCPSTIRQSGMDCTSCPDAIAKVIKRVAGEIEGDERPLVKEGVSSEDITNPGEIHFCLECGERVEHEGGCVVCRSCGFSKCG